MKEKVSKFEVEFGKHQAFGAINGTHIPVQRPMELHVTTCAYVTTCTLEKIPEVIY